MQLIGGTFGRDPALPTRFGKVFPPDDEWLATAEPEDVIEPDLPIVDAHHHLWDRPGHRYLLHEFMADVATGHNVVATVFNECQAMYRARGPKPMQPVGEVEFCAGMAAMSDSGNYGPTRVFSGLVGYADLLMGDRVAPVLDALTAAGGGRLRGIRYEAMSDTDPDIDGGYNRARPGAYLQPELQAGVRRLASYGLSFDAQLYHTQLPDLATLARACPEVSMVLCHTGLPLGYARFAGRQDEVFAQWKAGMAELAKCGNISVKLGGLTMRLGVYDYGRSARPIGSRQLAQLWRPYLMTCVELFGPNRCMVESNFPVEKMGIGYAALWNTFKRVFAPLSQDEKIAIFGASASRVYRLQLQ